MFHLWFEIVLLCHWQLVWKRETSEKKSRNKALEPLLNNNKIPLNNQTGRPEEVIIQTSTINMKSIWETTKKHAINHYHLYNSENNFIWLNFHISSNCESIRKKKQKLNMYIELHSAKQLPFIGNAVPVDLITCNLVLSIIWKKLLITLSAINTFQEPGTNISNNNMVII